MYINLEKIGDYPELLQLIKDLHGNILPEMVEQMINAFGEDFEVILKCYSRPRLIITLNELLILEDVDPDLYDDISEVFIHSEDYNYIMENIEEEAI